MCCIPTLYSVMVLFYIEVCGSIFFAAAAAWCVLPELWSGLLCWEVLSDERSSTWSVVGFGGGCTAASDLPAEPVAASRGLKHAVQDGGRRKQPTPNTDTDFKKRDKSTDFFNLSGLVVFSQIKLFGHNNETTQQGAYLSLTQLQYKTVRKRQKKICKKGFLCSRSTTHWRHCIPGFYIKALEVSFLCIFF